MHDCSYGSHGGMMIRYYQFIPVQGKYIPECPHHAGVCRHSSGKYDRFFEFPALCNIAPEISCKGKTQSCHNIVKRCGNLLMMNHVALCKHTASSCNTGRINRF